MEMDKFGIAHMSGHYITDKLSQNTPCRGLCRDIICLMKMIIGIDEVGRGPLAGPVTVCAVFCEEKQYQKLKKSKLLPRSGKDSKKLSEKEREEYSKILKSLKNGNKFFYAITHISNKIIDQKGISHAIKFAIEKNLKSLNVNDQPRILLDGGLKAPSNFKNQKTIIKGDEKEKIIAWASILAKVSRDKIMRKSHAKYLPYNFHINKGYGTLSHRMAINKHGICDFHRVSFCKNLID